MFTNMKKGINEELYKFAKKNIITKLKKQGVDCKALDSSEFDDLVADEIEILKADSKKVGAGIGIGILLSLVTGI